MRAAAPAKTAENISWLIAIIYGLGAGNTHTYACAVHTYIHMGMGPHIRRVHVAHTAAARR